MSKSSRKGDLRENEFATLIGGKKISRKGYEGPDVESPPLRFGRTFSLWEVKSKEDLPAWLAGPEGWLGQMKREGADAVVFRQNRGEWYAIIPLAPLVASQTAAHLDASVPQHGGDLVGNLGRFEGLESLKHPREAGHLIGQSVDLVLQLRDAVGSQFEETISVLVGLLASLGEDVDEARDHHGDEKDR